MCNDYTRQDNLRYEMAALGKDAIKNELLKNTVNVATYQIMNDTRAGKGYEMLDNPDVLLSACESFAFHRGNLSRKISMNNIAATNPGAIELNNELDLHYAKYGDRPMELDSGGYGGK